MRENTGQARRQYRQMLSVSTKPPEFADPGIGAILVRESALKSAACGTPDGLSGFIQLIDIDHEHDTSRTGFARVAPDLTTAARDGLCFVEGVYDDPPYHLPALPTPANWPKGLPTPMPLPWQMKVVTAFRNRDVQGAFADFDVSKSRVEILARFAEGGDLYGKFNGIFYLDEQTGYMHGYSPLAYIVNYGLTGDTYNAIPLREAEIKFQLNDPAFPNCAGSLLGDNPDLPASCAGDATHRLWGCPSGNCSSKQLAPNSVQGYFLITELEQIYNTTLGQTLCNAVPAGPYAGWKTDKTCRSDPQWNPADPVHGLPPGDWCAATSTMADASCHDAWQSISFSTFQAFPVRDGVCTAL
jgi:hypothetical protein